MENFKALTEEESKQVSPIISKIYDAISKKVVNEMKPCNKNNPTNFGGVNFFFSERPDKTYLVWDKHSDEWDEKAIMEDINNLEYYIAKLRGLID